MIWTASLSLDPSQEQTIDRMVQQPAVEIYQIFPHNITSYERNISKAFQITRIILGFPWILDQKSTGMLGKWPMANGIESNVHRKFVQELIQNSDKLINLQDKQPHVDQHAWK